MRLMLTSCGLETEEIKQYFLKMLGKHPNETKALFIPTAAIDADAIAVLPKCMNDLLKCMIPKENITVYDLHENISYEDILQYDIVYLCGGRTSYLLERINDSGFRNTLLSYIENDGFVLGVSAGSLVFANNLPGNLGPIDSKLNVHCEKSNVSGAISVPLPTNIKLSNNAAIIIKDISRQIVVIDS